MNDSVIGIVIISQIWNISLKHLIIKSIIGKFINNTLIYGNSRTNHIY
jgi:hypothetical protein